jgi:hypothetical protein
MREKGDLMTDRSTGYHDAPRCSCGEDVATDGGDWCAACSARDSDEDDENSCDQCGATDGDHYRFCELFVWPPEHPSNVEPVQRDFGTGYFDDERAIELRLFVPGATATGEED